MHFKIEKQLILLPLKSCHKVRGGSMKEVCWYESADATKGKPYVANIHCLS